MNNIVEIRNLTVGYDDKPFVLRNVNLDVVQNDFLGIIGPNGGGKTTLLRTILGLIKPKEGSITFRGEKAAARVNIGYLPQINQIDKKFPISVHDVILSGLTIGKGCFLQTYTQSQKEIVVEIAKQMGVDALLHKAIGELSGGQLQRTLLGRAIVDEPELLILDEPNSYVDKHFESNFYHLLDNINKNTAIILVSHDIGTVVTMVKNVACVNEGLHYHSGTNISPDWLEKSYGSCPIELVGHGNFPHRILERHEGCECCND